MEVLPVAPPADLVALAELVEQKPESFFKGDEDVQSAALKATKFMFDFAVASEPQAQRPLQDLLAALNETSAPTTRSQATSSKKRKRSPLIPAPPPTVTRTPLEMLYVQDMNEDQIWEQLELRTKGFCEVLSQVVQEEDEDDDDLEARGMDPALVAMMNGEDEGEYEDDEDDKEDIGDEMNGDDDLEDDGGEDAESDSSSEGPDVLGEEVAELRDDDGGTEDDNDDEDKEDGYLFDLDRPNRASSLRNRKRSLHPTLDDEFFSIDEFNRETEEMEALSRSRGRLNEDDDDEEEEEDVDLFGMVEDVENFEEEDEDEESNDPYYKDFFAPPPRSSSSSKKPLKKKARTNSIPATFESPTQDRPEPPSTKGKERAVRFNESVRVKNIKSRRNKNSLLGFGDDDDEDDEEDGWGDEERASRFGFGFGFGGEDENVDEDDENEGEDEDEDMSASGHENDDVETMERLNNDLFAEDEDPEEENLSTHQKRLAQLSQQISQLESENVGQKEWTLLGEAGARSRPVNSLLEEDLDYERVAKVAPVVTEESTKGLEEKIKARILENRFDDVIRKRAVDEKPFLPSKFFELQDSQSARSLAQIYEDEYTAKVTGDTSIVDDRDGKLAKEHEEIEKIWGEICYKLDALCNAHFTPKQPKATISTISNIASTSLESALPTTQTTATLLAPEEIHAPVTGGTLRSKSELTPTEKRSARTKDRKKRMKQREGLDAAVDKFARKSKVPKNVKEAKGAALKSLVKTGKGVTVVGKEKVSKGKDGKKEKGKDRTVERIGNGHSLKL